MSRGNDIGRRAERGLACNMSYVKGVLAINAASAATVKTTNALTYTVDGVQYTKTALSAQALTAYTGNTFYTQPASTTVYYVLGVNAAGTVYCFQGTYTGQTQNPLRADFSVGDGSIPDVPDGVTPFGMIKVVTGATTFLPGTDALDKASVTFTFYDLAVIPSVAP